MIPRTPDDQANNKINVRKKWLYFFVLLIFYFFLKSKKQNEQKSARNEVETTKAKGFSRISSLLHFPLLQDGCLSSKTSANLTIIL